ncbi:YciI family protein [Neolewinella persica]|uniref:YciI family protein n=1 Tax=Neolewinella persica TaxID=70998 RepID=UPI000380348B|nr:YciI family protein [Neolewinella persica]
MRITAPFTILLFVILVACETAPEVVATEVTTAETSTAYDPAFAARVGADDYGMKQYVMAFLKAGPNRDRDSTEAARLQAGHMANIRRMAEAGELVLAGPFLDDGELRGIYIFNVKTIEEARALTATDPAIQAGSLVMELKPWYGSAAMMEINAMHSRLKKPSE